ncbi:hypothetical protein, partial [Psychromonas sp. Urea-02u-13]|uniref:hypothetical protein n=1 Tax=Psychromonas sp. Urea-02u-13 TaxID=2058326 RepID=UPI000CCAC484
SANLLSDVYKHISQITNPALNPYGFPIEVKSHKSTSSDCQSGDYSMQVQQPTAGIGPATLTMNNCLMGYSDESNRVTFNGKK